MILVDSQHGNTVSDLPQVNQESAVRSTKLLRSWYWAKACLLEFRLYVHIAIRSCRYRSLFYCFYRCRNVEKEMYSLLEMVVC